MSICGLLSIYISFIFFFFRIQFSSWEQGSWGPVMWVLPYLVSLCLCLPNTKESSLKRFCVENWDSACKVLVIAFRAKSIFHHWELNSWTIGEGLEWQGRQGQEMEWWLGKATELGKSMMITRTPNSRPCPSPLNCTLEFKSNIQPSVFTGPMSVDSNNRLKYSLKVVLILNRHRLFLLILIP